VIGQYDAELRKEFEAGGYVLLGWAEVGFIYVFTNTPVTKVDDIRKVKMWQWEGDPVAEATFKAFGINPIQLSITDVLTSLQTGLINAMYISPLAGVSLQWTTATKYMLDYPLTNSSGAVVLSKKDFDKMPPDLQEILLRNGKQLMRKLTELSRQGNIRSLDVLKKNKIIFTKPDTKEVPQYEAIGKNARRLMVGKLYSEDLLNRVEQSVADFRAKEGK
jgi:TRAP-type C4-dicarboxylate transport system substrate-binding protein